RGRGGVRGRGVAWVEVLGVPPATTDFEMKRRIERAIQTIHENDTPPGIRAVVVRVAAQQNSDALLETLLGYVPFVDSDAELDEIRAALSKHALKNGKVDPRLVAALSDRAPRRRAAAAETLARVAYAEHKDALRKLLEDP